MNDHPGPLSLDAAQGATLATLGEPEIGERIYELASDLYPICRSITGDGVRHTLRLMKQRAPLELHEIATGSRVHDWVVPREWNIREAYIKTSDGRKIVDFAQSNLHVLNYSSPVRKHLTLNQLRPHLYSMPEEPDLVPYRTSYYADSWGFCVPHRLLGELKDDTYEVVIDSELKDGALCWGEHLQRGRSSDEVLFSAHVCHPSLANDNCSGLALLTLLAERLSRINTHLSYRFLFAPGTIGSIAWLSQNEDAVQRIRHGLVVSCVGDSGPPTYKRSRRGDAMIDRAVSHVLRHSGSPARIVDFSPYGYDERQFCSPGYNLPVGLFQRSPFGEFREYHTSADNLDFITPTALGQSYDLIASVIEVLENDCRFINLNPKCEPQLGRRGLYASLGGDKDAPASNMAMLWVLNLSDGYHSLLDIAERADMSFSKINAAAQRLARADLLRTAEPRC